MAARVGLLSQVASWLVAEDEDEEDSAMIQKEKRSQIHLLTMTAPAIQHLCRTPIGSCPRCDRHRRINVVFRAGRISHAGDLICGEDMGRNERLIPLTADQDVALAQANPGQLLSSQERSRKSMHDSG